MSILSSQLIHNYVYYTLHRDLTIDDFDLKICYPSFQANLARNDIMFISISLLPKDSDISLFHDKNSKFGQDILVKSQKLTYKGIRTPERCLEKYNSVLKTFVEEFDANKDSHIAEAIAKFNEILKRKIDFINRNSSYYLGNMYSNLSNFDFSEDDDPHTLAKIEELEKKSKAILDELNGYKNSLNQNRFSTLMSEIKNKDWHPNLINDMLHVIKCESQKGIVTLMLR